MHLPPIYDRRSVDLVSATPGLETYVLARASESANATLSGYFVDEGGVKVGAGSYTGTVDGTPRRLFGATAGERVFALVELPPRAVGFIGRLTGNDLIFDLTGDPGRSADMTVHPGRYPVLMMTDYFTLGRVS
jgi:hypothetical protein